MSSSYRYKWLVRLCEHLSTLQKGSHLIIQVRERSFFWPVHVKITETLLSFEDAQNIVASDEYREYRMPVPPIRSSMSTSLRPDHLLSDNPKITIDFATVSYSKVNIYTNLY